MRLPQKLGVQKKTTVKKRKRKKRRTLNTLKIIRNFRANNDSIKGLLDPHEHQRTGRATV